MNSILVTGVGGGVGQSIIKSLYDSSYSVVGADGEVLGTGLYAVDRAHQISYADKPDYIEVLLEICEARDCALIFPGLDAELGTLSHHSQSFRDRGVIPVVSSMEVVETCDDKFATYEFLASHGFNAPRTLLLSEPDIQDLGFPLVLKPRRGGRRSQGVFIVNDERELDYRLSALDSENYVAQEYIAGDEYTCGSVNFEGRCYGVIAMRRILRDGDTYKAFVERNPTLEKYVGAVAEALQPFGPCNFQLRLHDDEPFIFEINARCSGTTYCRMLAGFNEPLMAADYLLKGKQPEWHIKEIAIMRYWRELPVSYARIDELEQQHTLHGDGQRL